MISPAEFEKLGIFYLGRELDPVSGPTERPLLYDARDLNTHAVCVGMTGSGKTGLCISLLEEAAIDRIPAIIIDPKGDMGNLLLGFPDLGSSDFQPWLSSDEAARKNMTLNTFADATASKWREGLASWAQDGERIRALHAAAEFAVYTPGSEAGLPVSVLSSFAAPPAAVRDDADAMRDRILGTTSALLGLLGIEADPIRSREHILISTLLQETWKQGRDMTLTDLILGIQSPPVKKVGVFDMDTFYPAKERFELALALNNLIAAPSFASWLEGQPLDIGQLLFTAEGKPRHSIFSIAHLSDAERMFFVTLLLNQVLTWVRSQPGTQSLRAILYMDEVFGFFPPVANPPSKLPMLTLLKQARAFGVGIVLATQNPVDLDYKGLSNTGTWFIGRLQTEQDRDRLVDGLMSAATASPMSKADWAKLLAGLEARTFVMQNVHESGPVVFQTRWALSFLAGPLTLSQIKSLMSTRKIPAASPIETVHTPVQVTKVETTAVPPRIPEGIIQVFLPGSAGRQVVPHLLGIGRVHVEDTKTGVNEFRDVAYITPVNEGLIAVNWRESSALSVSPDSLAHESPEGVTYLELPDAATKPDNLKTWEKEYVQYLYQTQRVTMYRSPSMKMISAPDESIEEFRSRVALAVREKKDATVDAIRQRYMKKVDTIQRRLETEESKLVSAKGQMQSQAISSAMDIGATLLGSLFGGRRSSVGTVLRSAGRTASRARTAKAKHDQIEIIEERMADLQQELLELDRRMREEVHQGFDHDNTQETIEELSIAPKKSGITVKAFALAWVPVS